MKNIPYGDSNFEKIVRDGSFFVDNTSYIELLEKSASHITFLRPRRFGKSLWISILEHYYGWEWREQFKELFGHLYMGKNPTAGANQYLVLKFDFSQINTKTSQSTLAGFLSNVKVGVGNFLSTYAEFFTPEQRKQILKETEPGEMIKSLFSAWVQNKVPHKIYVVIDEYDHFANELIAFRLRDFREMVSANGFVRKFYETIKAATQSGAVENSFLTGVSPVTLDSLTSGFNISKNRTTHLHFHNMLGFTAEQTADALRNVGASEADLPELMEGIARWYNGYRFHPHATQPLYNPEMVLYFADHYADFQTYPEEMLDPNIASDFSKIRQTFRIADREQVNRVVLDEVLTEGFTSAQLTAQFSFERGFTDNDFKSLLFYLGYLTIKGEFGAEWQMKIPNQVIRNLYWDYFATLTIEMTDLAVRTDDVNAALRELMHRNDPMPLVRLVEKVLASLSNRDDMGLDEKHVKAILASYLSLSNSYLMRSEFETDRKYVDILLLKRPPFEMPHQFAFELKYLKKGDAASEKAKETEAETQLRGYLASPELAVLDNLRAWVIVFVGTEAKVVRQL